MSDTWTIQRILAWIEEYLGQHGDEHPRTSSQWLVSEALGLSRMQLFLDLERPLSEDERAILRDYTRRRAAGEPLQYITGEAPFRYITVKVAPGVLIPRPETEVLVSVALSLLPKAAKPQDALDEEILRKYAELTAGEEGSFSKEGEPDARNEHESHERLDELEETEGLNAPGQHPMIPTKIDSPYLVADICTGTGCIACSIASERNDVRVIATDIAKDAITLADENIQRLELSSRVTTRCCDLGDGIAPELIGAFDLVVSNPPYIPTEVLGEIPSEVSQYEPKLALDGGTDGLDVYRKLLDFCAQALKSGGGFAIELHETTLDAAVQLASEHNFIDIEMTRDLNEKPRVISARKR